MEHKVGDIIQIKSLDWYNKNKNSNGLVTTKIWLFIPRILKSKTAINTVYACCTTAYAPIAFHTEEQFNAFYDNNPDIIMII